VAAEHLAERQIAAVLQRHVVVVVVEDGTIERDASEEAFGPRVGEELGVELPVSTGLGVAPDGTGGSGCISADLELVLQHILEALLVHGDEEEAGGRASYRPAKAATGELGE